jgi:hypothetical protein
MRNNMAGPAKPLAGRTIALAPAVGGRLQTREGLFSEREVPAPPPRAWMKSFRRLGGALKGELRPRLTTGRPFQIASHVGESRRSRL